MPGHRTSIPKETRIAIAHDLADGVKLQKQIAADYKIDYAYLRRIATGQRVPEVKKLVDALVKENTEAAMMLAKRRARSAVATLVNMQTNAVDPKTGQREYKEETQRGAANDLIELAFRDVASANTSHQHLHVDGGVVLLADVARKQITIPPERAAALGIDPSPQMALPPANGNGHGGNGHGGNGHSPGGNGHATSPDNGHTEATD